MTQSKGPKAGVKRKTLTAIVTDKVRERIISGELKGGQPLRQDALAEQFEVSHIPVREALMALEVEGLVTFVAHRGAVVKEISIDEIDELFSIRALLECDIFKYAFDNLQQHDLDGAATILDGFQEMLHPSGNTKNWGNLNWDFHNVLYRPANRERELSIIEGLHVATNRYLRLQIGISGSYKRADGEHKNLLDLCVKGDKKSAVKLLKDHIISTKKDLVENLKF